MDACKIFVLLFVLAMAISKAHGFEVSITNNMGASTKLTVHCRSGTTDLGSHEVEYECEYKWDFSINVGAPVIYDCDLFLGSIGGQFMMFNELRDTVRCGGQKCFWRVIDNGIYLFIKANNRYEKQYSWS